MPHVRARAGFRSDSKNDVDLELNKLAGDLDKSLGTALSPTIDNGDGETFGAGKGGVEDRRHFVPQFNRRRAIAASAFLCARISSTTTRRRTASSGIDSITPRIAPANIARSSSVT